MILNIHSRKYGLFKVIIDDDDAEKVYRFKWSVNNPGRGRFYIRSSTHVLLHRFIINAPQGKEVDHINGDLLDNRKLNLRVCDRLGNTKNRAVNKNSGSGFRGVYWERVSKKWVVAISVNKRRFKIGRFKCKEDAARAYNEAAKKYHKEYARLNEVSEE